MSNAPTQFHFCISLWTFKQYPNAAEEWCVQEKLDSILEAGFDHVAGPAHQLSDLAQAVRERDIQFAGQFQLYDVAEAEALMTAQLEVGHGPVNCQLGFHDTTLVEAIEMIDATNAVAERLGADLHYEVHRNTAFETPEKTAALIETFAERDGPDLRLNFDFSHPALVKHLIPEQYAERLLTHTDHLRACNLIHLRPFNGQHCQLPVTDGQGELAPECEDYLEFARAVLSEWIRENNNSKPLWVVPELGPVALPGYGLSCFPDVTQDAFRLARELEIIWSDLVSSDL